jgi:hypothetical protein
MSNTTKPSGREITEGASENAMSPGGNPTEKEKSHGPTKLTLRWNPRNNLLSDYPPGHVFGPSREARAFARLTWKSSAALNKTIFNHLRDCFDVCGLNVLQQNAIIYSGFFDLELFSKLRVSALNQMLDRLTNTAVHDGGAQFTPDIRNKLRALLLWTFACRKERKELSTAVLDGATLRVLLDEIESSERSNEAAGSETWNWVNDADPQENGLPWKDEWPVWFTDLVNHGGEPQDVTIGRVAERMAGELEYVSEHIVPFEVFHEKLMAVVARFRYSKPYMGNRAKVEKLLGMMKKCNVPRVKRTIKSIRSTPNLMNDFDKTVELLRNTILGSTSREPAIVDSARVPFDIRMQEEWDKFPPPPKISDESIVAGWLKYNNEDSDGEGGVEYDEAEEEAADHRAIARFLNKKLFRRNFYYESDDSGDEPLAFMDVEEG